MEPHILRNATVVGVKVLVVPLVATVVTARAVRPAIVAAHGQHVVTLLHIRCQVEAASHHPILAEAQVMTVQVEVSPLSNAFELDE